MPWIHDPLSFLLPLIFLYAKTSSSLIIIRIQRRQHNLCIPLWMLKETKTHRTCDFNTIRFSLQWPLIPTDWVLPTAALPLTDQGLSLSLSVFLRIQFMISMELIACIGYCRDGLSTRPVGASEEIQLRIDPLDLDDEITGLHRQVRRLKHVCIYSLCTC